MLVDFTVESLTEHNLIFDSVRRRGILFFARVEPEPHSIKEVKPGPIDRKGVARLVIGPEKDGGSKYPLETLRDAAITLAVFEEMEKIEDLGSCAKSDNPTALTDGHGGYPDRD